MTHSREIRVAWRQYRKLLRRAASHPTWQSYAWVSDILNSAQAIKTLALEMERRDRDQEGFVTTARGPMWHIPEPTSGPTSRPPASDSGYTVTLTKEERDALVLVATPNNGLASVVQKLRR